MNARFVLAKYAPDLARMEPRNIGLFLWHDGHVESRFLSEADADFISDMKTYRRWVQFWTRRVSGEFVQPNRGKPVPKSDPACIDAIVSNQKGNYLLVDAGEMLTPIAVKGKGLDAALSRLFSDLVATREAGTPTGKVFARVCNNLFQAANVPYKTRQGVEGTYRGVKRTVHPDYYIGNGKPAAVVQRVKLSSESNINSAVLLIDSILNRGELPSDSCRVMIRGSDAVNEIADQGLLLLDKMCGVIDVEKESARSQVEALGLLNGHRDTL